MSNHKKQAARKYMWVPKIFGQVSRLKCFQSCKSSQPQTINEAYNKKPQKWPPGNIVVLYELRSVLYMFSSAQASLCLPTCPFNDVTKKGVFEKIFLFYLDTRFFLNSKINIHRLKGPVKYDLRPEKQMSLKN